MTIGWPRCFCSSGASGRKMLSVSPPAAHGTIILIGRSGNWAAAGPARDAAAKPRMAAARSGFLTCFLPSFFLRPAFQLVSGQPGIDTVVCRHEAGAGFMALADARLTGRPGVACVSRGPGASNAAIAVHTAQQDGVPFILLVGQVAVADVRRDSFQEIDYGRMFGSIAKWVAEVADPARIPETILRGLQVAMTGLPGPVVIALPEDVLAARFDAEPVHPQALVRAAPH